MSCSPVGVGFVCGLFLAACSGGAADPNSAIGGAARAGAAGSAGRAPHMETGGINGSSGTAGGIASPPRITDLAYFSTPLGPKVIVAGETATGTLTLLRINYFAEDQTPVLLDFNGDGEPESSALTLPAGDHAAQGVFFMEIQGGLGLAESAPRISVTVIDGTTESETAYTRLDDRAVRGDGETCDPRGFDSCGSVLICSEAPDRPAPHCQSIEQARQTHCAAAPVLDGKNRKTLDGTLTRKTYWTPPQGCVAEPLLDRLGYELILHLEETAQRVVLTTDHPETDGDPLLFILPNCGVPGTDALACNDDLSPDNLQARVTLTDLPPGDYPIVVESLAPAEVHFRLSVALE